MLLCTQCSQAKLRVIARDVLCRFVPSCFGAGFVLIMLCHVCAAAVKLTVLEAFKAPPFGQSIAPCWAAHNRTVMICCTRSQPMYCPLHLSRAPILAPLPSSDLHTHQGGGTTRPTVKEGCGELVANGHVEIFDTPGFDREIRPRSPS